MIVLYVFRIDIWSFFKDFWHDFKENWLLLPLGILAYKLGILSFTNLMKRFAINKSANKIKKLLFHGELDELITTWVHINLVDFKNWSIWKKILSIFPPSIAALIATVYSWSFFVGKFLAARFWTGVLAGILAFIQSIPGFFNLITVAIWLWLEKYFPWLTGFYTWMYGVFRTLLDPIWDNFLVPIGNIILDIVVWIEVRTMLPISILVDKIEIRIIGYLKFKIFNSRGEKYYRRVMKVIEEHNNEQRRNRVKKKHERQKKLLVQKRKLKDKIDHIKGLQKQKQIKKEGENTEVKTEV